MKHNFSRELACFNLAQEIIEGMVKHDLENAVGFEVDGKKIETAFVKFIGRASTAEEAHEVVMAIIGFGPDIQSDCATFAFAHDLYHIVED